MGGLGLRMLTAACGLAALWAAVAGAAKSPPPPPHAAGTRTVTVVARGVPTPTEFAVAAGRVFVSGYGNEQNAKVAGGVYVLGGGKATRVPGSPAHVFGLAAGKGTLYLSSGKQILAWSGWDGRQFQSSRVVATGPDGFGEFNGLAIGPDGLIYVGSNPDTSNPSYVNSFLTVDPASGTITVLATGIRQPWQPLFLPGRDLPLVSDLNQDDLGPKRPPDYLLAIERGADYGFPACPATPATCVNYAKPFVQFPAHASPMGLGYLKGRLYIALYGGLGKGSEVVSMPATGGKLTPFLTGYAAPVIAVGTIGARLYTGDQSGAIYRVAP
jgi:glucose/arabinose dehydrogenase